MASLLNYPQLPKDRKVSEIFVNLNIPYFDKLLQNICFYI